MKTWWNKVDDLMGKLAVVILILAILFILAEIGVFEAWVGQFEFYKDYYHQKHK